MFSRVGTGISELVSSYDLRSQGVASRDVVFGRGAESDIVLNTDRLPLLISRKHAVLSLKSQKLCIEDKGSTNGTYVNEQRLQPHQSTELREGSLVSFGGPKLIVREGQQHSNPFVYKLSQVAALTSHGDAAQSAPQSINAGAAAALQEQAVDLTRTVSLEAGPSDIVDLTNSPDLQVESRRFHSSRATRESRLQNASSADVQPGDKLAKGNVRSSEAGHKRARAMAIPVPSAAPEPEAVQAAAGSIQDSSAKKALENEFECTICRDFMVATHSVVPCGHMFCGECLSQWLQKNPSCPKCRAGATGWVQTIAVDNVLESLVERTMTAQELQERKQRKKSWEAQSSQINNRMKNVFRGPAMPMHGVYGPRMGAGDLAMERQAAAEALQAAMSGMPGFAGMMWPGGRLHMHPGPAMPPPLHRMPAPRAPPPQPQTNYTVAYNVDTHRILCKTCRNAIASNTLKVGYRDRGQMRWFHLGCLSPDRWQQASLPGRLNGMPELPPAQQGDVRSFLNQ